MEKETTKKVGMVVAKAALIESVAADTERQAKELLKEILREQEGMEMPLCEVDEDGCYYEDDCWLVASSEGSTADVRGVKVWIDKTMAAETEITERIVVRVVDDNGGEYDENIFSLLQHPATEIICYLNERELI